MQVFHLLRDPCRLSSTVISREVVSGDSPQKPLASVFDARGWFVTRLLSLIKYCHFPRNLPRGFPAYSATGASTGQVAAQEPQSMQSSLLISYFPSFSLIASTGHSAAHAPQPMQASVITYAIKIHLHKFYAEVIEGTLPTNSVAIISYFQ